MFKEFLMKKMLAAQLKDVPKEQQEKIFSAIEKNPDFFKEIVEKIQAKVSAGKDQKTASLEVAEEHRVELQNIMQ